MALPLADGTIGNFPGTGANFKLKQKITGKIENNEIPLINSKIKIILTWSVNCMLSDAANQATTFEITDRWLVTFRLQLYQLKIIQSYYNNQN